MVYTRSNRRLSFFLAMGLLVGGALSLATPAHAQGGRFQVLVPKNLEMQGDVDDDFGEDLTDELKELIDDLPTHKPVSKRDLKAALKQYKIDDDDLNCITSRQLAVQRGIQLVLCGQYGAAPGGGMQVSARFISAKNGETFEVEPFTASDPKQAARQIFSSFDQYVKQVSLTGYCMEYLESQQWDNALENCEKALAITTTASALYGKGYALMKQDQLEPALAALEQVLEQNPVHQEALMAAGFVTAKLNRQEESRAYYNQYLELNPGNAQVRLTVAMEAAKAGDPVGALQIAEAGMQGDSVDLTLQEYAGHFALAAAAQQGATPQGQNGGGETPPEAVQYYEKALGYYEAVFAEKGNEIEAQTLSSMINTLVQLKRYPEAVDLGARAVAAKPDQAQILYTYAIALQKAGKLDEALAASDSVLALDPEYKGIVPRRANWLLTAGRMDDAKAEFGKAVERQELTADEVARAIFSYGYNDRHKKGDNDAALQIFGVAREFAEQPQTKALINFFSGYILYNRGMKVQEPSTAASAKQALPIFQRALEYFQQSRPYTDTAPSINLDQFLNGTQQYIEIQEALMKRGR